MRLTPLPFAAIPGWSAAAAQAAWPAFLSSCRALIDNRPPLRPGVEPSGFLREACRVALDLRPDPGEIASYFESLFQPRLVAPDEAGGPGFVTGYYEPEIEGALEPGPDFAAPILARPSDLIDMRGTQVADWDRRLEGARYDSAGRLEAYPDRTAIEAGAIADRTRPVVWLRDHVEVFFVQVQGSARIRLPNGSRVRLVYDGRNGRPYSSIGRALIEAGEIAPEEMSLARCKQWLRTAGLEPGAAGRNVLQRNQSYVFFRLARALDPQAGPIGAQGVPLSPLQSIAVDRAVWPYATPVWIEADLSGAGLGTGPTGRLMIAQDTGSAIVGPARGDLFIGTGGAAGDIAGQIRHSARFIVLTPAERRS